MNFNFGEVLSRAWQIVWKHKVLWVFGILASCNRGGSRFNFNQSSRGNGQDFGGTPQLPPQFLQFLETVSENIGAFIAIAVAVTCIFWLVAIFLGTIGKIGLIRGTSQVDSGTEHLIFGQLFSESTPYFWRMFGLSLLVSLPIIILVAAMIAGIVVFAISMSQGNENSAVGFLAMMPVLIGCLCLLIPVMFVVSMIVRQAENAIVLEDAGILPSLSRGWDVFRQNLGPIILMAIIVAVIGLVVGFIIALPVLIVVLPAMISFMAGEAENFTPLIFMFVCLCLYAPVSLLLNGVAIAYIESVWTLTYLRLTGPKATAPVIVEANA